MKGRAGNTTISIEVAEAATLGHDDYVSLHGIPDTIKLRKGLTRAKAGVAKSPVFECSQATHDSGTAEALQSEWASGVDSTSTRSARLATLTNAPLVRSA